MMNAHLAVLAVTLIYGLFYVAIKLLVNEITPWETFCLRLLLATPILFVLERLFFRSPIQSRADLLKIGGLGLLGISLVQMSAVFGVQWTSVFHVGFIVGTAPLNALILAVLFKQERLTPEKLLGILIAFAGLAMLLFSRNGTSHLPATYLLGDVVIWGNIAGWSLFLVLSRPLLQRYPAFSLTSHAFSLATLLTLPVMLLSLHRIPGAGLSTHGWLWMAFVVLLSTVGTYSLNYYALSRLPVSTVSVYVFLQPLFTAIFAHWILHEPISSQMILQGGVILIGVMIATGSYRPLLARVLPKRAGLP